ncbi:MAG: hypothetical protein WCG82_08715 [Bacteroidota bacterium]
MIKIRKNSFLSVLCLSQLIITGKLTKRFSVLSLLIFTIFSSYTSYSQDSYRRHFIITYDISNNFRNLQQSTPRFQRDLEDLFQNLKVNNPLGNANILLAQRQNGIMFFDKERDEISFFHFNINQNEIAAIRGDANKDSTYLINSFINSFFKNTNITWTSFKNAKGPNVIGYMFNTFNSPFIPSDISIPNFVYPLILNKIDNKKPAEEYILIVLALRAPMRYTSIDLNYINTIYQGPLLPIAKASLSVGYIKNYINKLSLYYDKTNYFNYSYTTPTGSINSSIGIFGYKITPKDLGPSSSANTVTIGSDIKFSQKKYKSNDFITTPIKVKFPDNEFLTPVEVTLTISTQNKEGDSEIFNDVIASQKNKNDWSSAYLKSNTVLTKVFSRLMKFNRSGSSYTIPLTTTHS